MSYCSMVAALAPDTQDPNRDYHDHEYGFWVADDNRLFERLVLEINQAGLSWTLILKKRAAFQAAYAQFDVAQVAAFDAADVARLLADAGIVRNRLKIQAAIYNAQVMLDLQREHGSFAAWLLLQGDQSLDTWLALFKKRFKFVGGQIVNEFLMSLGLLPGAHQSDCPIAAKIRLVQTQPS